MGFSQKSTTKSGRGMHSTASLATKKAHTQVSRGFFFHLKSPPSYSYLNNHRSNDLVQYSPVKAKKAIDHMFYGLFCVHHGPWSGFDMYPVRYGLPGAPLPGPFAGLALPGSFAGLLCGLSFAGHIWMVPNGARGIRALPDSGMPPRHQISQSIDFGSGTPSFLSSFA